ncbi:biotin-dependent carboxyltransferase family protein [Rheinheimera sp.]|uniref:5-oxoprolinase subunit C family protein n=1 Tax=Rheinheimera sp. TaxID=1869214 RepID=UPI00307E6DCA
MSGFVVEHAGILTTLQDAGRVGGARYGLTQGGAADSFAYQVADVLLEQQSSCQLEITLGGLQLQALQNMVIAVTGAELPLWCDDAPLAWWRSHRIQAGQRLHFGMARTGVRSYLAVAGGIRLPKVLGSNSTVLREGVGGIAGKPLQAGQFLPVKARLLPGCYGLPRSLWPDYTAPLTLRLIPGFQADLFSQSQWQQLMEQSYTISAAADRMGYRLTAPQPLLLPAMPLWSEGTVYGAVQCPPDGHPIVLLNDRQTLGGYPKPGAILPLDAACLSQRRSGQSLRFTLLVPTELPALRASQHQLWQELRLQLFCC